MRSIIKVLYKNALKIFIILLVFSLITCNKDDSKLGRSGYYIEESTHHNSSEGQSVNIPQIYYFFDRTISMRGFVTNQNSEYINIIPQLWLVAESSTLWPDSRTSALFHTYGEGEVRRVSREFIRDRIRRGDFYPNFDGTRVFSSGNRQVFSTAVEYIKQESTPEKLFILVTDLYEQHREDNCFSILFKNAFENGLSGAIITVQSEYNGSIENISSNLDNNIRVNAISTFFILIVGSRGAIEKYCETFFATSDFQRLKAEKVLFLLDEGSGPDELPWSPVIRNANSERIFDRIAYNNNINLKEGINKLFTAQGTTVDPLKIKSFRLVGNVRSQYIGGLPVFNFDSKNFNYESSFTSEYSSGERIPEGQLSSFELMNDIEKANIAIDVLNSDVVDGVDSMRYPLIIAINTKNNNLKKGCYRINYEIFQKAKIPQWVIDMNAATIEELNESNKPNSVIKILRLESIYRYIVEAYNNRSEWGRIYSNSIYFEKPR